MLTDMSNIQVGGDVYGSDGEKVGTIGDVGSNYLLVTKGFLFTKDIYIPPSAVSGIEQDRVYLNVAKDQIENMGWDQPPLEDSGYAASGYGATGTATADTDRTVAAQTSPTAGTDYVAGERVETTDTDVERIPRYEEELQAEKSAREAGAVRVSKDVVEEQQTLEVPVTREEVHVRSVSPSSSTADSSQAFQADTIEVPVREEDVQVTRQARVAEELEIEKRAVQDTERVSDTVRREDVHVERVGDVDVEGGRSLGTRES